MDFDFCQAKSTCFGSLLHGRDTCGFGQALGLKPWNHRFIDRSEAESVPISEEKGGLQDSV